MPRLFQAGAVKDYIKMLLENDKLKFLVFAHHLSMLQACTEAVIESKVSALLFGYNKNQAIAAPLRSLALF